MSKPVLFNDLDKTTSEFFTRGFFGTDNKLSFKTKAPGDQTIEVKATRKADGKISGEQILARSFTNGGVTYKTEGSLNFDGKVAGTLTITDVYKGLELSATADTTTKFALAENVSQDQSGKLAMKYKQDAFTIAADIQKKRAGKLNLGVSSTVAYNSFTFGAAGKAEGFAPNSKDLSYSYELAAAYSTKENLITVKGSDSMNQFTLGYHHKLNSNLQVATQYIHSVKEKDNSKRYTCNVGANYVIDADSSVKGTLSSNGVAKVSYATKLNRNCSVTLSAKVDTTDLAKGSDIGLEFKFEA